jgi:hypothetical protein
MTAIRERMLRPNTGLLQFWRSPIVLCSLATGAVAAVVLGRAVTAMHDASTLRREVHQLAAQVAAEESALAFVQSDGQAVRRAVNAGNGLIVETSVVPVPQSSRYRVRAEAAEMQFDFVFQRLGGGTPLAFGRALTLGPDAAVPVDWLNDGEAEREDLPSLVAPRQQHDAADGIAAEDAGIALLRLPAGTDRLDFVLGSGKGGAYLRVPDSGVVRIDGNLWVDSGGAPLELHLVRDLTIVVQGNAYLGRALRVRGGGSLTIATCDAGGVAFSDLDGNGRWGNGEPCNGAARFEGPVEGAGNVYLGMPREVGVVLEFDAGIVCGGVLHVAARQALVHGPVLVNKAGVRIGIDCGNLVCTGGRLPSLRRSTLPGFAAVGSPRPSPLVPVRREQPLYSAAPAR